MGKSYLEDIRNGIDVIKFIQEQYENMLLQLPFIMREVDDMQKRWPLSHIPNMTIEEWVTNGNPFCFINMIENKTNSVASGFIFFNRNRLFYQNNGDSQRHTIQAILKEDRFRSLPESEVFRLYMKEIYDFINNFDSHKYVSTEYLYGSNIVKSKLIMLYKGDKVLSAFSSRTPAVEMAKYLGIKVDSEDDSLGLDIKIQRFLESHGIDFVKMNTYIVGRLVWNFYAKIIKINDNRKYLAEDREEDNNLVNELDKAPKPAQKLLGKKLASSPVEMQGVLKYPRDPSIAKEALFLADYICECGKTHPSFIKKSNNKNYTEPHHLIPISAQGEFEWSLDVLPNIVSLCSNCHNHLHYGINIEILLRPLFEKRKIKLAEFGLEISFEELLSFYEKNATD